MKLNIKNEFRSFTVENVDAEKRTVTFAASSEYPVERYDGKNIYREILSHDPADVDMTRMNGAPLLDTHKGDVIGVVESCAIQEKRMIVTVRFGTSARAEEIFNDVKNGIRRNVSIGYLKTSVVSSRKGADGVMEIRFRWTPYEVSMVPVPADPTVGIGREINLPEATPEPEKGKVRMIIIAI